MAEKKEKREVVERVNLMRLIPKQIKVKIVGDTPLLMNKFSDRTKKSIVNKQTKKIEARGARDIKAEVNDAIHYTPDGKVGFPASGFKKAMVEVAPYFKAVGLDKKRVKGSTQIIGNLIPIKYKEQLINEANVKINRGASGEVRYRPEFVDWSCELTIRYNESLITAEQIVNLLNYAGFHIGVGDWTPQHSGTYGMFHVEE